MTEQTSLGANLALARAAERIGRMACRWLPYSDECPDHLLIERDADEILLDRDLAFVREALKNAEFAVLVEAESAARPDWRTT